MPELSIRQLADKLNVSHTAVRDKMKALEKTTGQRVGRSQGAGKPTLLNENEQALIASEFYVPAGSNQIDADRDGRCSSITRRQSDDQLTVYQPPILDLQFTDSADKVTSAMNRLSTALERFNQNGSLIDQVLINQSSQDGKELGAKMALAKLGNAMQTKESAEAELLRQLGLLDEKKPGSTGSAASSS